MSDIDYAQALSRLRSEMECLAQERLRCLPRHLIKEYWEVRYYFHWIYDDWYFTRIDTDVVKLGSAMLVAETLVSEYGFSWVEGSAKSPAIRHPEIWPETIALDSIDSGDWAEISGTNWLRESRRRFDKAVPFKTGEITFEFYFYVRSELAWRLRHKQTDSVRLLSSKERQEINNVLATFREKWRVSISHPFPDGSAPDFVGTPADITELQWLRYEGCYGFVDSNHLMLVETYIVGLVLSSLPGIDLVMVKLSDEWQLALRGLPEPGVVTTVDDYRNARWFHRQAASWLDGSIDEPCEEAGYSLLYFEFVEDCILQQGRLWSQTTNHTFAELFKMIQNF